jgi:hypothetical protein
LSEINFEAWKFNAEHFFLDFLEALVADMKVHIVDKGKNSLLELLLLEVEALLHEWVVPQEGRVDFHRKFLHLVIPAAVNA